MSIKFDKLFILLKSRNHSSNYWLRNNGFHSATAQKLKKNLTITTETVNRLCELLNCQPGDILSFEPDDKQNT